jgi:putative FmdB family regulatory protein
MPTYEYRCPKGHEFEEFQRMSDPPVAACPECGAQAERLLSAGAGLIFKGSGFYITDYRNDSYKKAAAADKGGAGSSGSAPAAGGAASSTATSTSPGSSSSGASGS